MRTIQVTYRTLGIAAMLAITVGLSACGGSSSNGGLPAVHVAPAAPATPSGESNTAAAGSALEKTAPADPAAKK